MSEQAKKRTIPFDNKEGIQNAVKNHENFEIGGCQGRMSEAVLFVERTIGSEGMTSRIYTKGRATALLIGIALPAVGVATTAALAAHKLATINPDYEVVKRPIDGVVGLIYVKGLPTLGDDIADAYNKATRVASEAVDTVTESWNKHAPSKEAVIGLAMSGVPSFLSRRAAEDEQSSVASSSGTPGNDSNLAQTAVKIQSLQQNLERASTQFAEQNKTNEFIVCLYAVGIAMAACDGKFDDEEAAILKEYILGASSLAAPSIVQTSLQKLTQSPPDFDEAIVYVKKLDPVVWPVIDDILTLISEADGVVCEDEQAFFARWQDFKKSYEQ